MTKHRLVGEKHEHPDETDTAEADVRRDVIEGCRAVALFTTNTFYTRNVKSMTACLSSTPVECSVTLTVHVPMSDDVRSGVDLLRCAVG